MKIILNLDKSYNNYHWEDKEELRDYLNYALGVLWNLQRKLSDDIKDRQNEENRLYDILDIFEEYKILDNSEIDYNEKVAQFKNGFISMEELINSLGVDLLECDKEDLKKIIGE